MDKALKIEDLWVQTEGKEILQGLSLEIEKGSVHAIMGPNGAGKSTLAKVLLGDPAYEVVRGKVWLHGEDLLEKAAEERAHAGLFLSFQYPPEIAGISNETFLRSALQAKYKREGKGPLAEEVWQELFLEALSQMEMDPSFAKRGINEGFSGGEKKKNEILQMQLLRPSCAILDETDSGLDIDAIRIVAKGVEAMRDESRAFILITHYQRLLELIRPDFVHVLQQGKIVKTGDWTLALELEETGYVG